LSFGKFKFSFQETAGALTPWQYLCATVRSKQTADDKSENDVSSVKLILMINETKILVERLRELIRNCCDVVEIDVDADVSSNGDTTLHLTGETSKMLFDKLSVKLVLNPDGNVDWQGFSQPGCDNQGPML